jgi:outer membrane immunogenic protein
MNNGFKLALTLLTAVTLPAHAYTSSFSGAYLGLNAGYSAGKSSTSTTTHFVSDSYFGPTDITQINDAGSKNLTLHSFIGGIQGGYNYTSCNFLLGLEADINSMSSSDSSTRSVYYITAPESAFTLYTKVRTNWLFTLRPRIGYVVNNTLFYITGGLAITQLKTNDSFSDDYQINTPNASNAFESASASQTKTGGIIGGGIEYAVTPKLSVKAEYLYARFGHVSSNGNLSLNPIYVVGFNPTAPFHHKANFTTDILRVGVNYHF